MAVSHHVLINNGTSKCVNLTRPRQIISGVMINLVRELVKISVGRTFTFDSLSWHVLNQILGPRPVTNTSKVINVDSL
jgi:hypothetical protein